MTTTKRTHTGIADMERKANGLAPEQGSTCAIDPNPARMVCLLCGRKVAFFRRSHRNRAHWAHTGDGLAQYRSWGVR